MSAFNFKVGDAVVRTENLDSSWWICYCRHHKINPTDVLVILEISKDKNLRFFDKLGQYVFSDPRNFSLATIDLDEDDDECI